MAASHLETINSHVSAALLHVISTLNQWSIIDYSPTNNKLYIRTGEHTSVSGKILCTSGLITHENSLVSQRPKATRRIPAYLLATCIDRAVPSQIGLNLNIAYETDKACSATMEKTERFRKWNEP